MLGTCCAWHSWGCAPTSRGTRWRFQRLGWRRPVPTLARPTQRRDGPCPVRLCLVVPIGPSIKVSLEGALPLAQRDDVRAQPDELAASGRRHAADELHPACRFKATTPRFESPLNAESLAPGPLRATAWGCRGRRSASREAGEGRMGRRRQGGRGAFSTCGWTSLARQPAGLPPRSATPA